MSSKHQPNPSEVPPREPHGGSAFASHASRPSLEREKREGWGLKQGPWKLEVGRIKRADNKELRGLDCRLVSLLAEALHAETVPAPQTKAPCIEACGVGCPAPEFQVCGDDGTLDCTECWMVCAGVGRAEDRSVCEL